MFILKPFQEKRIAELRKTFLELWKTGNKRLPLIFKAPTGSGKTVMIAQFLKDLSGDPQFDADKCFLWFSFSEDSYTQSKGKLFDYYGGAGELELLDLNDLNRSKLEKNNIFFINWQKIKDSTKEGKKLRRDNEQGINFDSFIKKTQEDNREIILIIDEAHRDTDTELADELVDLIDPRIILKITATPKSIPSASDVNHKKAGFVEVDREEVVGAGLIKEKVVTQTEEDLERVFKKEIDQDKMLLELTLEKRLELKKYYNQLKLNINPIVLIQLPNDDRARRETLDKSKLDIVKEYLEEKGIGEHQIAIWLSEKKENLKEITKNNSDISFLIFKQAAATGWDCPRASILVMFREIKSPIFHTQTVGRILRMPEAEHYPISALNIGYLYTNYGRQEIIREYERQGENKPADLESKRKPEIKAIDLESIFASRPDYNDLGDSFQKTFKVIANKFFNIKNNDDRKEVIKKLKNKDFEIDNPIIENKLVVDAEIENYDNFVEEIRKSGSDLGEETSRNDLERMYNLLCFNIINKQEDQNKKFAPERSWGKLKTALNVWLSEIVKEKREVYYKIIIKDLLKPDSKLKSIISDALGEYRPIREQEVEKKAMKAKRTEKLEVPQSILYFTDDYEELKRVNKSAMSPFYIGKEYDGKKNEESFIDYLESKNNVDWWYKNGDYGSQHLAIPYYDTEEIQERLFYPDWIVRLKNGKIYIFETKKGDTAKSIQTKNKAEELQRWLDKNKQIDGGGIVVESEDGIWRINKNNNYTYDITFKGWENLNTLLK